jgi:hypothetical protein
MNIDNFTPDRIKTTPEAQAFPEHQRLATGLPWYQYICR